MHPRCTPCTRPDDDRTSANPHHEGNSVLFSTYPADRKGAAIDSDEWNDDDD